MPVTHLSTGIVAQIVNEETENIFTNEAGFVFQVCNTKMVGQDGATQKQSAVKAT